MSKKKVDNQKPSFELMKLNYDRVEEYRKNVPEMILHEKKKFEWDDMIRMELHLASHYQHLFANSKLDYLFNKKQATWKQIYDAILNCYTKDEKKFQKQFDEEYQYYNDTEHTEIKRLIQKLKKEVKNEKDFQNMLKSYHDFRSFDTDGFYVSKDLIFNYCVNHKVSCDIIDDDSEYTEELIPLDLKKVEKLRNEAIEYRRSIEEAAKILAPLLKQAIKKDKSCGEFNFFSDVKNKISQIK